MPDDGTADADGFAAYEEMLRRTKPPVINPAELEDRPVPARQWLVEDWLPVGAVTGNYGDGGTGKTLLAQQLQTSCATGVPWCGLQIGRCRSFALYCEDSEEELHRRQNDINTVFGLEYRSLGDMRWISGVGNDWTLVNYTSDGNMRLTAKWKYLREQAKEFGARLVVLDTAADLFGGNENDRSQVRRFIGLLAGLARDIKGAVLLNCHPSRSGLKTGDLDGGSTGWSNTFRSRWTLARPGDEDTHANTPERVLARRKANYAGIGESIKLRWTTGAFVPTALGGGGYGAMNRAAAEQVFMTLLTRCEQANQRVSDSKQAGNYAPRLFAKRTDSEGYKIKEFEIAMSALFTDGRIKMESYGRAGDARQRIVATDRVAP